MTGYRDTIVYLNGRLLPARAARVGILLHGLLYGDGLFETCRLSDGTFFRLDAHLDRLEASAARIGLALPWDRSTLAAALAATAAANRLRDAALRLTVARGEGPPAPDPQACGEPVCFVTARAAPALDPAFERGVRICMAGEHPATFLPGIKSLSCAPFQEARRLARAAGFDEAILSRGGRAVEASAANLFVVRGGIVRTPDLTSGCLPGIARAAALEVAAALGLPCEEGEIPVEELGRVEEAFLTNSVSEVVPVVLLDGRVLSGGGPGPVTRAIREGFCRLVTAEARGPAAAGSFDPDR